ncbi:multicopper oxidase family protein [Aeromicrobium sp. CTD01-1L150]|uniref:multicopper oxidase family protein n=1 Tax=Aeromicrobium sp. CTD01-1L150 TaxID=3341830 RepID=UPI0035BECAEB
MIGRLILVVVALGVAVGAFFAVWFVREYTAARVDTVGAVDFERPLDVPPLAASRLDADGTRVFELQMQQGSSDLGQGRETPTWGINGDHLGPTVRATRGEDVRVEVTNDVGEDTTLHWHGMHLPARMDGGPHQMVAPGETWRPTWTIDQPAATLWYHPHLHGSTAEHVYRGMAGMFIIDDEQSTGLDLPDEYGVDDVPLIVQDKSFTDDGELQKSGSFFSDLGVLGDTILVNGTPGPYLDVETELVRLRLLNGSTGRTFTFALDDERTFDVVATDGGLLAEPVSMRTLQLAPGERGEIVVRMRAGETRVLRSLPVAGDDNRFAGGDSRFDVMELRAAETLRPSAPVPGSLVEVQRLREEDADAERSFRLTGTSINGRSMDMHRIDETVEVGSTEIWSVRNDNGGTHHSFHVHDVQFQVLDIDGEAPPAHLSGWKDTVWLPNRQTVRLIMRFADHTDPDVPYMYHCHMLRHEDQGMMGQFVVVEPGQEAGRPPSSHDHH